MARDIAILTSNTERLPDCFTPAAIRRDLSANLLGRVGVIFYESGLGANIGQAWHDLTRTIQLVSVSQEIDWPEQPSPTVRAQEVAQTMRRLVGGNSIKHLVTVGYDRPVASLASIFFGANGDNPTGLQTISGLSITINVAGSGEDNTCFALDLDKVIRSPQGVGKLQLTEISRAGEVGEILVSSQFTSVPGDDLQSLRGGFNRATEDLLTAATLS